MPSFDIVSEIEMHEVTNAVDQAKRELGNRWDFKNVEADIELEDKRLTLSAEQEFQLEQQSLRPARTLRQCDPELCECSHTSILLHANSPLL